MPAPVFLTELPIDPMVALDNEHARELPELTEDAYRNYLAIAFFARGYSDPPALLIAFDQDAVVNAPNFMWFKQRLQRFVYVDRVVINAAARGQGLAKSLYETLIDAAARNALLQRVEQRMAAL
jgi:uncharacterized protein